MADWRSIPCRNVDWFKFSNSRRASMSISYRCRPSSSSIGGEWSELTLGELADMGVRAWRCAGSPGLGIGDRAIEVIMTTIDMAAEGRDVTQPDAPDAYVPKCERNERDNA